MPAKMIDLTDKEFGKLTARYRIDDKILPSGQKIAMWHCDCKCGNSLDVIGSNLRNGTSRSCGHCREFDGTIKDRRFHHLVPRRVGIPHKTKNGQIFRTWVCDCDCGEIVTVMEQSLLSNHTKSCGHLMHKPKRDDDTMMHKRFGMLVVTGRAKSHKLPCGSVYDMWKCVCDCKNTTVSFGRNLRIGTTRSCGCTRAMNMLNSARGALSRSELEIREWLDESGVPYETQKTFPGLLGVRGGLLSYDVALLGNNDVVIGLIEYQGEQHTRSVDFFGGTVQYERQVEHDARKRDFALANNIPFLELFYYDDIQARLFDFIEQLDHELAI